MGICRLKIADCRLNWSRRSRHIFKSEILNLKSALILVGCVTLARGLAAEGNSSLSDSKNESGTVTAAALLAQNEELRRQLSLSQETVQTLTTSLAESNAEAELFRRKFADLQLRMEALGLASASKDRAKLEQTFAHGSKRFATGAKRARPISRPNDAAVGNDAALFENRGRWRPAGANGCRNAVALNERAGE